jgi:hypothetical protein
MKDDVKLSAEPRVCGRFGDVVLDELETRMIAKGDEVARFAGGEVVGACYLRALGE